MNDYWYLDPDNYYILLAKQNIHLFILTEIIQYLQFLVLRSLLKEIFINWKGYLSFCDLIMLHSWVWLLTILLENTCINQLINWFHANTISNLVWVTSTLISIFFSLSIATWRMMSKKPLTNYCMFCCTERYIVFKFNFVIYRKKNFLGYLFIVIALNKEKEKLKHEGISICKCMRY